MNDAHYETLIRANALDDEFARKIEACCLLLHKHAAAPTHSLGAACALQAFRSVHPAE